MEINDEFFAILNKYYKSILSGKQIEPHLDKMVFSDEKVNKAIDAIDTAFQEELTLNRLHWWDKGIDCIADFSRLQGGSRLALVQELSEFYKDYASKPRCNSCKFIKVNTCNHKLVKMERFGYTLPRVVNRSNYCCEFYKPRIKEGKK